MKKTLIVINAVLSATALAGVVCLIALVRFNRGPLDIPPAVAVENDTETIQTKTADNPFRVVSDDVIDIDSCLFGADEWTEFYDEKQGINENLNIRPFAADRNGIIKNGVLSLSSVHASSQNWQQCGEYYLDAENGSVLDVSFWRNWIAQKNAPSIEVGYRLLVKDRNIILARLETHEPVPLRFNTLVGSRIKVKVLSFYSGHFGNSFFVFLINDRILACFVDKPPKGRIDIFGGDFHEIKFRGGEVRQPIENG